MKRFFVSMLLTIMALPAAQAVASDGCTAAAAGELDSTFWGGGTELDFDAWDTLIVKGQTFSNFGTGVITVNYSIVASDPFTNNDPTIVYTFPAHTTDRVGWATLMGSSGGSIAWTLDCQPLTPAPGTANIAVTNTFLDSNLEGSVMVSLTCTSGTISPSSATLGNGESQVFVIANIPDGVPNACKLTQTALGDYDPKYFCDPSASIAGDDQCANPVDLPDNLSTTSCSWSDVTADNVGRCAIYNLPAPVEVDVTKVWETFGAEQADFDPDVRITLTCPDALGIVGGTQIDGSWVATEYLNEADGDFDDEDDSYIGEGTAVFEVIPNWYPTSADPDDQDFTECYATENIGDSAVEVDNNCLDIEVEAGMGDECTITNTVFFEGIPTLSHYGMAIMALLMLGIGMVGLRRFG